MIDPQGQANKWIKKMHEGDDIEASFVSFRSVLFGFVRCLLVGLRQTANPTSPQPAQNRRWDGR